MNRTLLSTVFGLLMCGLVLAALSGCSEKGVNRPAPGDGSLVIDIQMSPSETSQMVELYLLTVTGPDMDPVVDTLRLITGHYLVGDVEVPVGERRLFVLEGIRGVTLGTPRVLYRGQTTAAVRPGVVTELDIVLLPVAPIAKLSPARTVVASGADLDLNLRLYNLPAVSHFRAMIEWDGNFVRSPSVSFPAVLGENVVTAIEYYDGPMFAVVVTDPSGASILDERGNALLASISFHTQVWVGQQPFTTGVQLSDAWGVGLEGDTIGTETFFLESAHALLTPIEDRVVVFPDETLDRVIRDLDNIPPGEPILLSRIIGYTGLGFGDLGVADLTGIENMVNLSYLQMSWNPIADISPLAYLTRLTSLYAEDNAITDISPLSTLTEMRTLDLDANWITDISALASMDSLVYLELAVNQVTDITPLAGLTALGWLYLGGNQISDIGALEGLTNLWHLGLSDNQIEDILPLVNNAGLDSGDVIELWDNTVLISDPDQQEYVQTLRSREVIVYLYQPTGSP